MKVKFIDWNIWPDNMLYWRKQHGLCDKRVVANSCQNAVVHVTHSCRNLVVQVTHILKYLPGKYVWQVSSGGSVKVDGFLPELILTRVWNGDEILLFWSFFVFECSFETCWLFPPLLSTPFCKNFEKIQWILKVFFDNSAKYLSANPEPLNIK